jgi:N-acetyl-anhydromuramyl-L-alanine amidase AmpD
MFIQATNYTPHNGPRSITNIVLHSMESQEKPDTAENVAKWFAGQTAAVAPRASAHFCIDSDSIVQCVRVQDVAWHAPGANHNGIGLEHAGRAAQKRAEWLDQYGRTMLELSARLCAHLCTKYQIPAIARDASALRTGAKGITTHLAVTQAFARSTHTDPGPGFPLDWYVQRVGVLMSEMDPLAPRPLIAVPL